MSNRYVRTLIVQFTILIGMTVVAIHSLGETVGDPLPILV